MAQSVLHNLPAGIQVKSVPAKGKKEVRAEVLLSKYRKGGVLHARAFPEYVQQCLEFPGGLHDDMIDAVGHGIDEVLPGSRSGTLSMSVQ
jgi:predicted phage terminase large subunit-like protein